MAADQQRLADLLVRCLEHEGVTCVFGIPGEENIYFTDALARSSIRYVLVRHEQSASFMAEIFGRLTGRAGVFSATLGPGAINLLLGTADATTNSTPVVAFSAQVGLEPVGPTTALLRQIQRSGQHAGWSNVDPHENQPG
jgi:acetolactate synthase-1/2/3 large subunit